MPRMPWRPKATPTPPDDPNIWRVRYDTIDHDGKITIRHSGRLLHLGIGRAHTRTEIIAPIHNNEAIISTRDTGEVIADFTLNPHPRIPTQKRMNPHNRGFIRTSPWMAESSISVNHAAFRLAAPDPISRI